MRRELAHHDIEASEILTCHQIGLDCQSHYAHKDVIAEVAVPNPYPPQLWDQRRTISFQRYRVRIVSKQAYMIKHRGCNKQVRERVCEYPDLVEHSNSVGESIHFVCLMALQLRGFVVPVP